jgi:hypothetical protein
MLIQYIKLPSPLLSTWSTFWLDTINCSLRTHLTTLSTDPDSHLPLTPVADRYTQSTISHKSSYITCYETRRKYKHDLVILAILV